MGSFDRRRERLARRSPQDTSQKSRGINHELVPVEEASKLLGVSRRQVNFLSVRMGAGIKVGNSRFLTQEDLDRLRKRPPRGRPKKNTEC